MKVDGISQGSGREEYPVTAPIVYLDHNATAPVRGSVVEAMAEALSRCGNPSSIHRPGRQARRAVEQGRDSLRAALGLSQGATVVFTSGGTEANRLALTATGASRILVSAIEHDSILATAPDAVRVPVSPTGIVDLAALERLLAESGDRQLLSVMGANNETGVIQPIGEIARLARWAGALFHCDAVQCVGRIPFDPRDTDLMTVSAHKLGGPQGVGALVARSETILKPHSAGGQEGGLRPGTENVAGIVGFGVAGAAAIADLDRWTAVAALRDRAEALLQAVDANAVVFGAEASRLPNTLCIAMPGVPAETQVIALDLAGIAVSAGAACSSGKVRASHVLAAMGVEPALAGSAIRISLGLESSVEDIDRLVAAWAALRRRTWKRA